MTTEGREELRKIEEEAREVRRLGAIEYTPKEKVSYNKFFHYKIAFYSLVALFIVFIIHCIHIQEFHILFTSLFFVFCLIAFKICHKAFKLWEKDANMLRMCRMTDEEINEDFLQYCEKYPYFFKEFCLPCTDLMEEFKEKNKSWCEAHPSWFEK